MNLNDLCLKLIEGPVDGPWGEGAMYTCTRLKDHDGPCAWKGHDDY